MRILDKHYIGGAWVDPLGPDRLTVINPANAQPSGEMALGVGADVDAAVAAARNAFESFGFSTVEERIELLQNIVAEYQGRMAEMAEAITTEMGAPKAWAEGAHAPSGLGHLVTAIEILKTYDFEEKLGKATVRKEPIGVVGMITPWNWPINQITCKVAPAIATGCTMVLKPSEVTPYSAQLFAEIMDKAGVPKGVFNMVYGEGPVVGEAMSLHPDIDMISITGSGRAGAAVQANAAKTIKRVTQELGGKSANIILDDADFEKVVAAGTVGVMTNTGQTCTALSRMLVPHDKVDEAAAIAAKAVQSVVSGDPYDPATTIGPIAHEGQFKKVGHMIQEAIDEGATLVAGGPDRPDTAPSEGFYVKPTVFSGVTPEMTIAKEEVFGPVIAIMGYEDEDDAVRIANDSPYGLSGAVQSGDPARARRVAAKMRTGIVLINGARNDLMAPFGGYKQSGNGREWGPHAFSDFLELKSVME
jgi:aldehyde dehydrogenase (NAD+)